MTLTLKTMLSNKINQIAFAMASNRRPDRTGVTLDRSSKRRRGSTNYSYAQLENRKMLAAASVVDGTLHVLGDNNSEVISVREVNSNLIVFSKIGDAPGQNIFTTATQGVDSILIQGFGGDDQLVNRTNIESHIQGGGGDDVIVGGTGDDLLQGASGNDRIVGDFGSNASNFATSTIGGDDLIAGGSGDDVIEGVGGNDRINGQSGNDDLRGGAGDDMVAGADGNDLVTGNIGHDVLTGCDGNDQVFGNQGNDVLLGAAGNDALFGGEGNDRLRGNDGIDFLVGGNGDDVLISDGTAGSRDILNGGFGNDIYRFQGNGDVAMNQAVINDMRIHDTIIETADGGNDTIEYLGLGVRNDGNVAFNIDATDVFRYQQRMVGTEVIGSVEFFSDLRESGDSDQSMPLDTNLNEVLSEGEPDAF